MGGSSGNISPIPAAPGLKSNFTIFALVYFLIAMGFSWAYRQKTETIARRGCFPSPPARVRAGMRLWPRTPKFPGRRQQGGEEIDSFDVWGGGGVFFFFFFFFSFGGGGFLPSGGVSSWGGGGGGDHWHPAPPSVGSRHLPPCWADLAPDAGSFF